MSTIYKVVLYSHIFIGFASLVLFWIPMAVKKGSPLHVRSGHWFAKVMYGVGGSALLLALMLMIDPIAFKFSNHSFDAQELTKVVSNTRDIGLFLLAISVLVIVGVRQGLQTVRARNNQALMRRADTLLINSILLAVAIWLGFEATGNSPSSVLFYIFSALCAYTAIDNLRFCMKSEVTRAEQIVAHIKSIVGAGIGSHTAFFVFGASRVLAEVLTGYAAIVPWVLPGVVGTVLISLQAKKYRPRKKTVA